MNQSNQDKKTIKAAMKKLRDSRKVFIKSASANMKTQKEAIRSINEQLKDKACTIPEISAATGASTAETLWYVSALKKYGKIKEAEKDGSYFKYALAESAAEKLSE
jgi:predicted transcriptional regulator